MIHDCDTNILIIRNRTHLINIRELVVLEVSRYISVHSQFFYAGEMLMNML